MPKFVIEREIPGAGKFTPEQLQGVAGTPGRGLLRGSDHAGLQVVPLHRIADGSSQMSA